MSTMFLQFLNIIIAMAMIHSTFHKRFMIAYKEKKMVPFLLHASPQFESSPPSFSFHISYNELYANLKSQPSTIMGSMWAPHNGP